MINVNSRTAKLRIATANTRLMQRHEQKFSRELSKVFGKQFESVAKSIADYDRHYARVIDAYNPELRTIYNNNIRQIMQTFGNRGLESINKEQKSPYTEYLVEIEKYIATYVAAKVQQVSNVTKNIIARIIAKGQDNNATNYEIAKQISAIGEISKLTRAKNIARTETHSAAMHSFQTSMNQSGMIREKEWITFEDSRTRTEPFNHVAADGERVNIKEPFRRTGEHLMYPGDPNGSAGNIINCRCNVIYHTNATVSIQ